MSIFITTAHTLGNVDRKIYSGFVEHMGRCVYGGIVPSTYPKESSQDRCDENNFRVDVMEAVKDLAPPLVRYPGGNYTAQFNWMDGVGPERKAKVDLAWHNVEANTFGTNEFMTWCKAADVEPFLCLNMGTGDLREALAWVEYCNVEKGSYYADLRRSHGVEKPYKVKNWCLGNEIWGDWQVAQQTKEDYAKNAIQWAKAIKLLDPEIKLVLCGCTGIVDWDRYVLAECIEWVDYHSIHFYSACANYNETVFSPLVAEKAIQITESLIDLARVTKGVEKKVKIAFDEWNVWDQINIKGSEGCEQHYCCADMLAVGTWLNIFIRQASIVEIACIAQTVNVISPLLTKDGDLVKQTIYWPLYLFSKYMKGRSISVHVECDEWDGELKAAMAKYPKGMQKLKWIDSSATVDDENYLTIAMVNKKKESTTVTFNLDRASPKGQVEKFEVSGKPDDVNTFENKEMVALKKEKMDWAPKVALKPCSITMLRWKM